MDLQKVYVVLDHPGEARNVGAACRAMANSGIAHLRIVGVQSDYDAEKVRALAIHAAHIYQHAEFFNTLADALADCTVAAGTTRRRGKKRKGKLLFPEEFAELSDGITGSADNKADGAKVAVVFGNERTGLTDEQLAACTLGVTIPSCPDFASLNLSHAVQIVCYHLFRQHGGKITGYTPLPLERIDKTVAVIADNLQKIGFFSVTGRSDMERFWRSMLSRAAVSEGDAAYLERIFTKAAGLVGKTQNHAE